MRDQQYKPSEPHTHKTTLFIASSLSTQPDKEIHKRHDNKEIDNNSQEHITRQQCHEFLVT